MSKSKVIAQESLVVENPMRNAVLYSRVCTFDTLAFDRGEATYKIAVAKRKIPHSVDMVESQVV